MPKRVIRDGFLDSERINRLSVHAECFFVRLMLIADDFGRFDGRPQVIRSRAFPLKDNIKIDQIDQWLDECENANLILKYIVFGKPYVEVRNFKQRLRAQKSKYPAPNAKSAGNCPHCDSHMIHQNDKMLETESEAETETETENILYPFALFWDQYGKKVDRKKCQSKFRKLKPEDLKKMRTHVPEYVLSKPDPQYRKNPLTYLNGECWNDEIILSQEQREQIKLQEFLNRGPE